MANQYSVNKSQELTQKRITLDPRSLFERFGAWLAHPVNYAKYQIGMAVLAVVFAFLWIPITVVMLLTQLWFSWQRFEAPLRMAKHLGGIDPSLDVSKPHPSGKGEIIEQQEADGILFLGNQRADDPGENLKELWATNSDSRTHMLLMGTTGSGKTVTLLSICFNALAWGSGFFYSDGKADSSLHAAVWSLCRRVGREDDYLVINFMTGGADPYKKKKTIEKKSNGMNPWYEGSPDFLSQLSSSLLPKASGDGAQWQQKAVNMMDALIRTLCYERAVGNITLSIGVIREYLALPNLVKLYLKGKKGEIPEFAFLPIKAYLETGLPGFRAELAEKPEKWDQTVYDQHGYLTGQYARTLSMLMDTYGYIFKDKYSEVDMMDVLLNRRILVVMIPTLEKSSQEAANLGKLVVSSIRLMMAMNLGHKLEGTYQDIIATKATNSPAPYIITMDELGYYFAEGIALMFAQARSLGFMMIAAGQDIAAMAKGDNKEEVDSMIANTKLKYTLALEDPDKTLDVFKKVAGESIMIETGSYEGAVSNLAPTNYRANLTGSIQRRDKITLSELKALKEMEGILIFKDQVTRARSFTWFHSAKFSELPFRINRFLQVDRPKREDLHDRIKPINEADSRFTTIDKIANRIRTGRRPSYVKTVDPVAEALADTVMQIEMNNPNETAINRGIAYYMAAVKAMRAAVCDEAGRYWEPITVDPATLDGEPPVLVDAGGEETQGGFGGDELAFEGLHPAYHNPPLAEKHVVSDLGENITSGAAKPSASALLDNPPQPTKAVIKNPQFAGLAEALQDAVVLSTGESSRAASDADMAVPTGDAEADLDNYLHSIMGDTGAVESMPEVPVNEPGVFDEVKPTQRDLLSAEPPVKVKEEVQAAEVVIGFTEQTADALVKIEEALGSENPLESMKDTEAEISAQLKWTKPVDEMTSADIDYMFNSIHANIERSANRVK